LAQRARYQVRPEGPESAEVKKFASVLYPQCLGPVEFVDYTLVASNR
jgi:hypothetical protein